MFSCITILNALFLLVCHAELNAILNKNSADIKGCTIYVALFPCNECSKLIIQAGIKEVIFYSDKYHDLPNCQASRKLLNMAGVKFRWLRLWLSSWNEMRSFMWLYLICYSVWFLCSHPGKVVTRFCGSRKYPYPPWRFWPWTPPTPPEIPVNGEPSMYSSPSHREQEHTYKLFKLLMESTLWNHQYWQYCFPFQTVQAKGKQDSDKFCKHWWPSIKTHLVYLFTLVFFPIHFY